MNELLHLPIDDYLTEIQASLVSENQLLLVAEPGAGKTTRVPPALVEITDKKILVLEPRRIAARAAAERICEEQNFTIGREVGYQVRFDNKTSPQTQVIFMSEALLWRSIQKDPQLKDIGVVIFDEFHERNIYSDISLGVLHELQSLERPDLKLVVMSATLNTEAFKTYWPKCKVLNVPGRTFPVEIFCDSKPQSLRTDYLFIDRVCEKIKTVWNNQNQLASPLSKANSFRPRSSDSESHRSILVFLPGLSEIRRVQERLDPKMPIYTLHGNLSLEEQKEVLRPATEGKIILATNVAESSLTIDGVDTVIDSGLSREITPDTRKFYPLLKTTRISKNSAEQRKGRAGRQYPGKCFQLWNKEDENTMSQHGIPDVLKTDLLEAVLFLLSINITNPQEFSWFDEKPTQAIQKSLKTLSDWGLLNKDNSLNTKGIKVSKWPLPPKLGFLVEAFIENGQSMIGCQIAALLLEKDPFFKQDLNAWQKLAQDSDLFPRLSELNEAKTPGAFLLIEKVAMNLYQLVTPNSSGSAYRKNLNIPMEQINKILLRVFSDSICRRRRGQDLSAVTVAGQGVELSEKSLVKESEFFLALQGHSVEGDNQSIVDLATPIKKSQIVDLFADEIEVKTRIEMQNESFFKIQQKFLKNMPLEEEQKVGCKIDEIPLRESFCNFWPEFKKTNKQISQWFIRYEWAAKTFSDLEWNSTHFNTDITDIALMGENSFQEVINKDWEETLNLLLNEKQKQLMRNEFPTYLLNANGKRINLDYEYNQINAELKIQDAFGWSETPRIAQGRISIRLILLGPHMRPLQTTSDLASFWQKTYQELRGALKAKYTKHAWPEKPWEKQAPRK
jgi:ATP-dependent helicase HrpB